MIFPEEDAPVLKEWIVKRLENTSDADADVLADYVLALLHNASDGVNIQDILKEEITPFLKEDTKLFAHDLLQTIQHKSYIPGAPPPPESQPPAAPPQSSFGAPLFNQAPYPVPTGPAAVARKRGFQDRGDFDAPNGREQFQGGGRPIKQPRRGGHKSYVDPDRPQPVEQVQYGYHDAPRHTAPPPFAPTGPAAAMPNFDPVNGTVNATEALQQLQQLQQQLQQQIQMQMAAPFQGYGQQQGFSPARPGRQKRGRCRDYDTKGYCARGQNCKYEHSNGTEGMYNLPAPQMTGQIQLPTEGLLQSDFQNALSPSGGPAPQIGDFGFQQMQPDCPDCPDLSFFQFYDQMSGMPDLTQQAEYDPNNATMMALPPLPQFPPQQQNNGYNGNRRDNRQGQHQRRNGGRRASFSYNAPIHDRTQTKVVVECIPEENFEEEQVRKFFSQFGKIEEVTMMPYKRLAVVKFDSWFSANAAWNSPKVIFDNRFVKVFWYKDDRHADILKTEVKKVKRESSVMNDSAAVSATGSAEGHEVDFDMEEFNRKQGEAQKIYEEKKRQKQALEKQRGELDKRQKELQARQEAEKQRLLAKLGASSKNSAKSAAEGTGTQDKGDQGSNSSAQTQALRATLAKLQEEAKEFGLDPNAEPEDDFTISTYNSAYSSHNPGRGGYYRGRASYAPRGSYRGGRGGVVNRHAAYAAYSLDNRPKRVAISGVDFSAPAKDEALRQHLFSLGEFSVDVQVTPAVTHISFADRKAAEKFYNSVTNKTLPGLANDEEVELSWVPNTAGPLAGSSAHKVDFSASALANGADEGVDTGAVDANGGPASQANGGPSQLDGAGDFDYDVAGDNEWDIQ